MLQTFSFRVHAVSDDRLRKSEALVLLTIKDTNDHAPQFSEQVRLVCVLIFNITKVSILPYGCLKKADFEFIKSPIYVGS